MNSSRVAFYMQDLSGGGVERMRLSLMAELLSLGISVTLLVGRRSGPLTALLPRNLPVVDLGADTTSRSLLPLTRVIRELRPTFLISSLDHNNIIAVLAAQLAGTKTHVVICQHNALSAEIRLSWKYRLVPVLYWLVHRWAKGVVAVSHGVADDLAAIAGIARSRITVIYNPIIGPGFFSRAAAPVPHPWLLDVNIPVFIFVGRLTEQKNPSLFLEAFALLRETHPARTLVVGEGLLLESLQDQVARLGLESVVAFVGFQANPQPWIRYADCLVLTSRYEGFGNVLIEALACGTPVVSTDCPFGPREALLDGAFGELVPVGDGVALARAMARAVCNKSDRSYLRKRADCFTASACADAHLALFARIEAGAGGQKRPFGLTLTRLSAASVIGLVMTEPEPKAVRLVVTPNIDHVRLLRDREFSEAYQWAHLICPDGFPVVAYARLRGIGLKARVTGCELFKILADHPMLRMRTIFLVVESKETEVAAREWARRTSLDNVFLYTAPAGLGGDPNAQLTLVQAIRAASPDILVMTLGAPLSETLVHRFRHDLPPCWALCIGQALRIHLGLAQRAPAAWQSVGLEWLWRILHEPRRLSGRYVRALAWFPIAVIRDILKPPPDLTLESS